MILNVWRWVDCRVVLGVVGDTLVVFQYTTTDTDMRIRLACDGERFF